MYSGYQLSKPALRAQMERACADICQGRSMKANVVRDCLEVMKQVFDGAEARIADFINLFSTRMPAVSASADYLVKQRNFSTCGRCRNKMLLKEKNEKKRLLHCTTCDEVHVLPEWGKITSFNHICPLCHFQVVSVESKCKVIAFSLFP
jgi:hypothetical protein